MAMGSTQQMTLIPSRTVGIFVFFLSILYFTTLLSGSIQTGLVQLVAFRRQNKCSNMNKEATPFQISIRVTGRGGGFVCFVLFQVIFTTSLPRECSFFLLFLLSFPQPPSVISSESPCSALTHNKELDAALPWI